MKTQFTVIEAGSSQRELQRHFREGLAPVALAGAAADAGELHHVGGAGRERVEHDRFGTAKRAKGVRAYYQHFLVLYGRTPGLALALTFELGWTIRFRGVICSLPSWK